MYASIHDSSGTYAHINTSDTETLTRWLGEWVVYFTGSVHESHVQLEIRPSVMPGTDKLDWPMDGRGQVLHRAQIEQLHELLKSFY